MFISGIYNSEETKHNLNAAPVRESLSQGCTQCVDKHNAPAVGICSLETRL